MGEKKEAQKSAGYWEMDAELEDQYDLGRKEGKAGEDEGIEQAGGRLFCFVVKFVMN